MCGWIGRGDASGGHGAGRLVVCALAAFVLAAGLAGAASAGDWNGQEVEKDGQLHVMNPATPMEAAAKTTPKELWRLGGDTDDPDEFFGVISSILSDKDGNIYLLDTQLNHVMVYSAGGEFLREIGREGEGPGEFRGPSGMFFTPDGNLGVIQTMPGKIVLLTPEGDPAGEYPLPQPDGQGFFVLVGGHSYADNVVLQGAVMAADAQKWQQTRYLANVSPDGKELARYHSDVRTIDFANPVMDDQEWDTFDRRWTVGSDGRVYAATSYPDYAIHIWKSDGTLDRVISREYEHRKRTADEIKLMNDLLGMFAKQIPNCKVQVTDQTKDIEVFYVHDDGTMWIMSSDGMRDRPDGSLGVFDVFDPNGRYLKQLTVMAEGDPVTDGYYFDKNRLYVVTDLTSAAISLQSGGQSFQIGDEEPEPMSVICYELDGALLTSR